MTYRPKAASKKETVLSIVVAVCALVLFALSGVVSRFAGIYQITAIILGVVSIEMYMKYVASDYIYEACDESFRVYKVTGKKSICVCSLDYDMSLSLAVTNKEYEADKSSYPTSAFNVNFAKNLAPKNYYVYFFRFNGKISMMKFEPDEIFCTYLNEKITNAVENGTDSDIDE